MSDTTAVRALAERTWEDVTRFTLRQCADEIDALKETCIDHAEIANALRSEVSELRNCAVLSDQENDRLRGQNERLRDDMVAIQWKASVLRELVREALTDPDVFTWIERAEKALEGTL